MMGLDNPLHIAFLLVILLLVFGAKRLPEIGRSLGEGMRGFKTSIEGSAPAGVAAHASASVPAQVPVPAQASAAQTSVAAQTRPVPAPAQTSAASQSFSASAQSSVFADHPDGAPTGRAAVAELTHASELTHS
jgi:sec-independent protein translocase protein TatA